MACPSVFRAAPQVVSQPTGSNSVSVEYRESHSLASFKANRHFGHNTAQKRSRRISSVSRAKIHGGSSDLKMRL